MGENSPSEIAADKDRGYYRKYLVRRADGTQLGAETDPQATYFVLRIDEFNIDEDDDNTKRHRRACRDALLLYASLCGNPHLRKDLEEMVKTVRERMKASK